MAAILVAAIVFLSIPVAVADYQFDGWGLTTRSSGTLNGTVFIGSVGWNGQTTLSGSFDVPAGTVREAYLYSGVWGGNEEYTGWVSVKFNGNELGPLHLEGVNDNNPNVWATTHGKYWWWYDVTNLVNAGQTNTANVSKINGTIDGRVYGIVLVVVLENNSYPLTQYWINEGHDALNYVKPHDTNTTYFNGTVTIGPNIAELTMVHLTAYDPVCSNCLEFNGNTLDTSMVDSNTFEINTWDVLNYLNTAGNQSVWYSRGEDGFVSVCNAILVLQNASIPDLIVSDIGFPDVIEPNTNQIINATIVNNGTANVTTSFNVSLYVDGVLNGTVSVNGLNMGESKVVNFTVNLSAGTHEFKVIADVNDQVDELKEWNNERTEVHIVGRAIIVMSNSDFDELVSAGLAKNIGGTYYIENHIIEDLTGYDGIHIENTNVPFVIKNCTIRNCQIYSDKGGRGIYLYNLSNGIIEENMIQGNYKGIVVEKSKYVDIINNTVQDSIDSGIDIFPRALKPEYLGDTQFVSIRNNTIVNNSYGIELIGFYHTVEGNTIRNNTKCGIYVWGNYSKIFGNDIMYNGDYGLKMDNSSHNCVFWNDFISNGRTPQAYDNTGTNYWNCSVDNPWGIGYKYDENTYDNYTGNYWSDCVVSDSNGDGINDSAYSIDGGAGAQDYRPLIAPWNNYTLVKCGDVNGDGYVTGYDNTLLKLYIGKVPGWLPASYWASDVNGDGYVTGYDNTLLKLYIGKVPGWKLTCRTCCLKR
ncbi:MAG: DUF3344 domain-containing protein [Candidatus Methanospirare jalkutatii]|nr:MAG: DUF3344 domain-containing protein [Candidatus Methanospirare jalkutatii]